LPVPASPLPRITPTTIASATSETRDEDPRQAGRPRDAAQVDPG
jgi:hypothetical protein